MTELSRIDPDRALQELTRLERPLAMKDGSIREDARAFAAQYIFADYWRAHGAASLENRP